MLKTTAISSLRENRVRTDLTEIELRDGEDSLVTDLSITSLCLGGRFRLDTEIKLAKIDSSFGSGGKSEFLIRADPVRGDNRQGQLDALEEQREDDRKRTYQ